MGTSMVALFGKICIQYVTGTYLAVKIKKADLAGHNFNSSLFLSDSPSTCAGRRTVPRAVSRSSWASRSSSPRNSWRRPSSPSWSWSVRRPSWPRSTTWLSLFPPTSQMRSVAPSLMPPGKDSIAFEDLFYIAVWRIRAVLIRIPIPIFILIQCCGSGSVMDPYSGAFWMRIQNIPNTDPDPHM